MENRLFFAILPFLNNIVILGPYLLNVFKKKLMPYTTARIGPNRWGLYYDERLLATVMTQTAALKILEQLYRSARLNQVDVASAMVPLKRSNRGRKKAVLQAPPQLAMASGFQS
jgi:hypothetical protein